MKHTLNKYFESRLIGHDSIAFFGDRSDLDLSRRVDILCKILMLQSWDGVVPTEIAESCYKKHILSLNGAKGKDSPHKQNIDDYIKTFKELYLSIKKGFDPTISEIPIDLDNVIIDGSHRCSILLYLNRPLPLLRSYSRYSPTQPFKSLSSRYCFTKNEILWVYRTYLRYSPLARLSFLFPARDCSLDHKVLTILNSYFESVGGFEVNINSNSMAEDIFKVLYSGQKWTGNIENNFNGAAWKAGATKLCLHNQLRMNIVYPFHNSMSDVSNLKELKNIIRNIYKISFHSMHTTDHIEENIRFYDTFIMPNKIKWTSINGYELSFSMLNELQSKFLSNLLNQDFKIRERVVLSGGLLFALLNIRQTKDIDYISTYKLNIGNNHADFIRKYLINISIFEIISNPSNFMWLSFNGRLIKTISPVLLYKLKKSVIKTKCSTKDKNDLILLQQYFKIDEREIDF